MRYANIARPRRRQKRAPPRSRWVGRPPFGTTIDPAAPPQPTKTIATAPPRPSATPAEVLRRCRRRRRPPGAARPHAEGRCGPRLPPTPGGKRASRSPRRHRRCANLTTGRTPPVGGTAPADDDGGRQRRALRAGGKTAADWAALDPAALSQRTETLATAPPRLSAAPAEAPRRYRRRHRPPGAARLHAEGVVSPDLPLRQGRSAPHGARAAIVAARIGRLEYLPPSVSPRPPTKTRADEDARREPAAKLSHIA